MFSKNRQFTLAKMYAVDEAKRAMISLYKKIRILGLPIDCQLKLFDSAIVPILTYGCEVWGFVVNIYSVVQHMYDGITFNTTLQCYELPRLREKQLL